MIGPKNGGRSGTLLMSRGGSQLFKEGMEVGENVYLTARGARDFNIATELGITAIGGVATHMIYNGVGSPSYTPAPHKLPNFD